MQPSFFDIVPVELGQLGSEPAVAVLREMLWAEVNNIGVPISDTDIPFAVNDADGGIDAVVKAVPKGPGNGLIFPPTTSYQVKAGNFPLSATALALIEELLITPAAVQARKKAGAKPAGNSHKPDAISPRVRACLDAGGTFVTILFGNDGTETEEDATENAIRKFLSEIDPKYKSAKIKVWRQSRICGLLRRFPAVSLQIKNLTGFQLLSHEQWSARPEMRQDFVAYGVDPAYAKGWAAMCDGSPRVAHVVGQNLRDQPADPLRGDGISMIWVRYLAGDVDRNTDEYRRRHLVLSTLALFKRFGWGHAVRAGAYEVHGLILANLDASLSKAQFGAVIEQMLARKILQGDNFLYITPRALQLKLWIDWWNQHGAAIDMVDLIPKLSPQMRQWFGEMIEYSSATPVSRELVAKLLGPDGLYADAEWLKTRDGGRFFFSLSIADPPAALRLLERTIGKMPFDELLQFEQGRRDVIWALEGIALHADLFRQSARLLLALAEAENETWSNNATGMFAGLFSLGYGEVAPTSLAPEHRLPVLMEALSQGELRAELALKAFDAALNAHSISRFGGDQPFRLNERVQRWMPKTYEEWFEAYKLYWATLRKALRGFAPDRRRRSAGILLSHMRELLRIEYLHGEILDTVSEIAADPEFDKREIISKIVSVLTYDTDGLPKEVASKLADIRDGLIGTSFGPRLKRYAGMDLLQDEIDRDGNEVNKTAEDIRRLASDALTSPDDLRSELPWLVTEEARNGYRFGYALSQQDTGSAAWPDILKAWQDAGDDAHDYFVGGYLRAIFERNPLRWEAIIQDLSSVPANVKFIPGLVWRSGMTERAARVLLDLAKAGKLPPQSLDIFSMGQAAVPISDRLFGEWLDFLVGVHTFEAAATALHLASMSLLSKRQLSADQLQNVITQPALLVRESDHGHVMLAHDWLELSKALSKLDASNELTVLETLLENMGKRGAITDSLGPDGDRHLDRLVSRHPIETWRIVSELIQPPMDTRGFVITRWLRGDLGFNGRNPGPMRHIPREEIWKWIAADPEKRAAYVVGMAPKDFEPETWSGSLIRALLCTFGDSDAVQLAVHANFLTGGWSGPASLHYTIEKDALVQMRASETNPNALRWLNEAIKVTSANIERAKIEEEARGY